ncbi:caspase b-like [Pimephales promelas]|uniref:caspase b-like n=1 Tax=Pimephales promelas TaxID=90988 RepID=UPI00195585A7|nr:caspase b-like [Pimephales promelas]KAG1955784.1 protein NLRC3-like [Pimephales promelas]
METKKLILDALDEIVKADFKRFIWHLWNGVGSDIEPIPRAKLEDADRQEVVDCMVQKYSTNAGTVAVQVLVNINQNDLADKLHLKLQKAGSGR